MVDGGQEPGAAVAVIRTVVGSQGEVHDGTSPDHPRGGPGLFDDPSDAHQREAVRAAFAAMAPILDDDRGFVVQPMVAPGVETIAGITHDPVFGPLVLFGLGGVTAELLRDRVLRILPVTDIDARELVRSLQGSPLFFGYRGSTPVDVAALEDLLLRVGALAERRPEIAELDCNPVIASPGGVVVVDVKARITPTKETPRTEELRRLQ